MLAPPYKILVIVMVLLLFFFQKKLYFIQFYPLIFDLLIIEFYNLLWFSLYVVILVL